MFKQFLASIIFFWILTLSGAGILSTGSSSPETPLIVSSIGPYMTIAAALAAAHDGDVVEVHGGVYPALVVEKSVMLEGVDRPVIDGGGDGTVVTLLAPGITFRGFEVKGSGAQPDKNHAGILVQAENITVEDNFLQEVLFGIFVEGVDYATLRGNEITGISAFDVARKGDGIRLWNSRYALLENNHVYDVRDIVMWYSDFITVRGNLFEKGRYGAHLMYCNHTQIENNRFLNNTVGIYTMYSTEILIRDNEIRGHHGASGYALGFKDAENVEVTGNVLVDNQAGAFLDGLPFSPGGYGLFQDNIFAFNNIAVMVMPAVRGAEFTHNTFWENIEQMAIQGGGGGENNWHENFWSDYTGYDAHGLSSDAPDGIGDVPYRAERLFENMTDRTPLLRALIYSPASQTLELAATSFPITRPQPKFEDLRPLMEPAALPTFALQPALSSRGLGFVALAATMLGGLCAALAFAQFPREFMFRGLIPKENAPKVKISMNESLVKAQKNTAFITVHGVTKNYKKVVALKDVSFELLGGEALALWGVNGAGKTTLIKALLGLIDFDGEIQVGGNNVCTQGKQARRLIGYVPQEFAFYDMRVQETLEFYARLKKTPFTAIPSLLAHLGLSPHSTKAVSALSGGLRQRLALAVALLGDPPVLLLDEPLANLDARARQDYQGLLAALRKEGKTLLFATHRMEEVEILADRVLVLDEGHAEGMLTSAELRAQLKAEINLTLWVPENRRGEALICLEAEGYDAHLNGKGTVVVRVLETQKINPFLHLSAQAIPVLNFEVEQR
ncbi:MAG: nitrous oxide reductase family maturation protein NosD [Anaerolineales bacterium]|nr:nitrous oxide reductase family maturation protein NosD [Anaerolineales bacterium]